MSYMNGADAISGSLAECYVTIDGTRYNFMQLINFDSTVEKSITDIPILGKTGKAHKASGWSGKWSATAHYNQSILRKFLLKYKKTGLDIPFDIQVTNSDPTSSVGSQTIILKNCLTEGGTLAKFDSEADYLDEDISGTFDDFEMPTEFDTLTGMTD